MGKRVFRRFATAASVMAVSTFGLVAVTGAPAGALRATDGQWIAASWGFDSYGGGDFIASLWPIYNQGVNQFFAGGVVNADCTDYGQYVNVWTSGLYLTAVVDPSGTVANGILYGSDDSGCGTTESYTITVSITITALPQVTYKTVPPNLRYDGYVVERDGGLATGSFCWASGTCTYFNSTSNASSGYTLVVAPTGTATPRPSGGPPKSPSTS